MHKLKKQIFSWFTDKRQVTFMTVPHGGKSVKQMVVPIWGIRWLAIFLIVIIAFGAGCYYNYRVISNKYDANQIELNQLRAINTDQKVQIDKLNGNVNQLKEKFSKLEETDKRVKQLID